MERFGARFLATPGEIKEKYKNLKLPKNPDEWTRNWVETRTSWGKWPALLDVTVGKKNDKGIKVVIILFSKNEEKTIQDTIDYVKFFKEKGLVDIIIHSDVSSDATLKLASEAAKDVDTLYQLIGGTYISKISGEPFHISGKGAQYWEALVFLLREFQLDPEKTIIVPFDTDLLNLKWLYKSNIYYDPMYLPNLISPLIFDDTIDMNFAIAVRPSSGKTTETPYGRAWIVNSIPKHLLPTEKVMENFLISPYHGGVMEIKDKIKLGGGRTTEALRTFFQLYFPWGKRIEQPFIERGVRLSLAKKMIIPPRYPLEIVTDMLAIALSGLEKCNQTFVGARMGTSKALVPHIRDMIAEITLVGLYFLSILGLAEMNLNTIKMIKNSERDVEFEVLYNRINWKGEPKIEDDRKRIFAGFLKAPEDVKI